MVPAEGGNGGEAESLEPMSFAPDSTRSLRKDICAKGLSEGFVWLDNGRTLSFHNKVVLGLLVRSSFSSSFAPSKLRQL